MNQAEPPRTWWQWTLLFERSILFAHAQGTDRCCFKHEYVIDEEPRVLQCTVFDLPDPRDVLRSDIFAVDQYTIIEMNDGGSDHRVDLSINASEAKAAQEHRHHGTRYLGTIHNEKHGERNAHPDVAL